MSFRKTNLLWLACGLCFVSIACTATPSSPARYITPRPPPYLLNTPTQVTPQVTPLTAPTTSQPAPLPTNTPTSELYGYRNSAGNYAFNYSAAWQGVEAGPDAHFKIADGIKLEITVRNASSGETLQSLVQDSGPLTAPSARVSGVLIAGEPALREDLADPTGNMFGRAYHFLRNGRVYFIALLAPRDNPPPAFSQMLMQFEQLMSSFQFLSP